MRRTPIRIGGSELLLEFLELAVRLAATRLQVLSPYVDDAVFADAAVRYAWINLLTIAHATIVVRTASAAEAALRSVPRRVPRPEILINRRLHAKVFVARRGGTEVALVGSQNLTGAALHASEEIGILINPGASAEHREVVRQLCQVVDGFGRAGVPCSDDSHPPAYRVLSRRESRPVSGETRHRLPTENFPNVP
jgi:phosphatidylserine/phosphatidylglycerophosphate/cardiolipin synthase-like enzyme